MPQIIVENLVKTFKVAERSAGLWGALTGVVRRRYRTVTALNDISFSMNEGEILGYIGPNGAGKSTTVKILSGILVPDSGRVLVLGKTPWESRVETVANIGVVFGQRTQLWWDLPVIESFELLRDIYHVPRAKYERNRDELIEFLNLDALKDTPVRQLSLGQRMRCDLAASLLHSPRILYLDEPTIGLDAVGKLALRDFIRRRNHELTLLNRAGKAFSSTLDLNEVLRAVLEEVRHLLGAVGCSAWLIDPETEELVCRQVAGPQREIVRNWRLEVGQGIAGRVARAG